MAEDNMKLPTGRTCSDCDHYARCLGLFGCKSTNVTCDWSPSRFVLASRAVAAEAEVSRILAERDAAVASLGKVARDQSGTLCHIDRLEAEVERLKNALVAVVACPSSATSIAQAALRHSEDQ